MVIDPRVLSQAVKTMTPKKERVQEAQLRGTIVYQGGEKYVRLDGASSESLTPIVDIAEGASDAGFVDNDRVLVLIKNHQAIITKNITTGLQAQAAKSAGSFVTEITDEGITTQRLIANDTFTNTLRANEVTADQIIAGMATIDTLDSNYAHITNGVIDNAKIGYADVNNLDTNYAHITNGVIDNATIGYANIDDLNTHYAEIDLANVNNAWIEYGAMKKAEVFDENVFDLSGDHATISKIDASKINVANLRADNLIVRRINGQPVVGGYMLIDSNSSGYTSKNPKALGWYEFVNAQWALSQDTTVDMTKAYYQTGNEVSLYDQQYINNLKRELDQRIDGAVESFTGTVVPTLTNWPYTDWYDTSVTPIHDERANHVGDIYYVVNAASEQDGYAYRFAFDNTTNKYDWVLIRDTDITKALSDISELQTFESETTSWIEETDEGLETIRTNHTTLSGKVDKTVKESIQLWFTKANTTAPNKPNSTTYPNGVTDASTAGNGWRVVVPAWDATYPNYFYCWQYKFVDGTFGWSNVVRDIAMGETQGTARDAKNTADNALPASTFETFESTTFTDLVDEVDEQSTTMTNMTTRLGLNADGTGATTDIVTKESALEQTVEGVSTRVGKTETKLIGMYATSSTAANARAKVATIVPALPNDAVWELTSGTMVTVKFVNANTYAATATYPLTLNVNSKGAKPIKTYSNGDLSEAEYKWEAGSTFTFVYNGTNWLMQDSTQSVRMNSNETKINQTATSIESLASGSTTYTKPDGTTATSTIGTVVNQTANNVLIKATRDGATDADKSAGGTSAVGLINVTPDTVKIKAKHVEITGTTIFNAVNSDDDAKAAMLNSEVQVGGRNILAGTVAAVSKATTSTSGYVTQSLYYTPNRKTLSDLGYVVDDEVTLSFDWKITNATTYGNARIEWYGYKDSSNQDVYLAPLINPFATFSSSNTYRHVNTTVKLTATTVNAKRLLVRIDNSNLTLTISNLKLEKGNKATTWTPAPEDALSESVPIYGRTNSSTAPTESALPTVIITNTNDTGTTAPSSNGNGWTKMHMSRICSSNANYKYLWTCNQLISAGGYLLGHTDIVADNGTTVINGDEITTGTISADRLNIAGTITAINNNTTTTINGGKIATNSISANRLRIGDYTNYITANENDAESIKVAGNLSIVDGWLYKNNTDSNAWLSAARSRWANVGDKYRITGTVKMANTGKVQILIYSRNTDESSINSNGTGWIAYNRVNDELIELNINSIITISHSSFANCAKCNVGIVLRDSSDNNCVGYFKNMKCERISDAQVGGTNILRRTDNITISGSFWPNYGWYKSGTGTITTGVSISDSPIPTITKAVQLTATNANIDIGFAQGGVPLRKGLVTQSVWAKGTAGDTISLQPVWANGNSAVTETGRMNFTIADGEWHRYTYTKEVQYDHPAMSATSSASNLAANAGYVYLNTPTVGHTLLVVGDKLEYGEKATEWTSGEDDYITTIDEAGIRIHPSNTLNNSAVINANGMEIFKGGTTHEYSVAQYGDTARIGKEASGNVYIGSDFIDIRDGQTVLASFSTETSIKTTDGTELAHFGYDVGASQSGTEIAPYYTLGIRKKPKDQYLSSETYYMGATCIHNGVGYVANRDINTPEEWTSSHWNEWKVGNYSVAEGWYANATGPAAHAEGWHTYAEGLGSHAEGDKAVAYLHAGHAEGESTRAVSYCGHAEGKGTETRGEASHSEGLNTYAGGDYSHAQNEGTKAIGKSQTVVGTYNNLDYTSATTHPSGDLEYKSYALIVGNGVSDTARSNALSVDWNGNVDIAIGAHYKVNGVPIVDYVKEKGTSGVWYYEKWSSGKVEAWGGPISSNTLSISAQGSLYRAANVSISIPSGIFTSAPTYTQVFAEYTAAVFVTASGNATSATNISCQIWKTANNTTAVNLRFHCVYFPSNY